MRTRRRAALRGLTALTLTALTMTALTVPAGPLPGAGEAVAVAPTERPARTVTFDVRTRGTVRSDVAAFARVAARTFNDRRGWSAGGALRFRQVSSGGDFTLWLAEARTVPSFSSACSARWSCRVGDDVIINDERWRLGTASWPAVTEYRRYVLNHEVGHWLGLGHTFCGAPGRAATVMQQQSKGLQGCRAQTWPLAGERRAAAANAGVGLRAPAPAAYAVLGAGTSGTEVHALAGASGWTSWLLHARTALGRTSATDWDFAVSDHDRDGVEDLYAIRLSGASGRVEVHVLSGASGYRSFLAHRATALPAARSGEWSFLVSDADADGLDDVVGVRAHPRLPTSVHVMSGASAFTSFAWRAETPLTGATPAAWAFTTADEDGDGRADLLAVARRGASGRTEVHALTGASRWTRWSRHVATPLAPTTAAGWAFVGRDTDGDGTEELVALKRAGASGRTELHVLDASFTRWVSHAASALGRSDRMPASFDLE